MQLCGAGTYWAHKADREDAESDDQLERLEKLFKDARQYETDMQSILDAAMRAGDDALYDVLAEAKRTTEPLFDFVTDLDAALMTKMYMAGERANGLVVQHLRVLFASG